MPADEFEMTVTCPVGACIAQCTYAYKKLVLQQNASFLKQVKADMLRFATESHNSGRHELIKKGAK